MAATNNSYFINGMVDGNLGSRLFLQSMFTTERGGALNYNQWTTTVGMRFDNRAAEKSGGISEPGCS